MYMKTLDKKQEGIFTGLYTFFILTNWERFLIKYASLAAAGLKVADHLKCYTQRILFFFLIKINIYDTKSMYKQIFKYVGLKQTHTYV